jgi:hypothetical protein
LHESVVGTKLTCPYVRYLVAIGVKADIERASLSNPINEYTP